MAQSETLIAAAVFDEVKPLIKRLGLARAGDSLYRNDRVTVALTGMGAAHASSVVARRLGESRPAAVWSVGVAGALRPGLNIGDRIIPSAVIDAATGDRFEPTAHLNLPRSGTLVTAAALASNVADKRALHERFAADIVDMETAAIARLSIKHAIPWLSVRTISDTADHAIPAALGTMVDARGQPALGRIIRWALRDPRRFGTLIRLGRNTSRAAAALADTVAPLV